MLVRGFTTLLNVYDSAQLSWQCGGTMRCFPCAVPHQALGWSLGSSRWSWMGRDWHPNHKSDLISFLLKLKKILLKYIYNFVLVLGVQQSASVIHIHISIRFQILSPYMSLQGIE